MNLSRRDAFRPAQGTLQATNVNFVFLAKKKKINWIRPLPPITVSRLYDPCLSLFQNLNSLTFLV